MELDDRLITAARALFMKYGIKSITMEDITRELGISKKTLYQVVSNKEELVTKVLQHKMEEDLATLKRIQVESIDAIDEMLKITRYILGTLYDLSPTAVFDLNKYYGAPWKQIQGSHHRHLFELIRDNLQRGIKQGLYRGNMNPDIIARLYVAKSSLIVDEEIFPTRDFNLSDLFEETIRYHMHGVASSKGLALLEKHLYDN